MNYVASEIFNCPYDIALICQHVVNICPSSTDQLDEVYLIYSPFDCSYKIMTIDHREIEPSNPARSKLLTALIKSSGLTISGRPVESSVHTSLFSLTMGSDSEMFGSKIWARRLLGDEFARCFDDDD